MPGVMAPPIVPNISPAAVSEDLLHPLDTVFTTPNAQAALDAAYSTTEFLLSSPKFYGPALLYVIEEIKKNAANKKQGARREGAMFLVGALFERCPPRQRYSEVIFLRRNHELITITLDALADKGSSVREGAQYALDALFTNLGPEALVVALLPVLVKYLGTSTGKWQGTVGALQLIGKMADKAKMGRGTKEEERIKDILRQAMGKKLEGLVPLVSEKMLDLKGEVATTAEHTTRSLATLLQNDDVEPRIPLLLQAMKDPADKTLQKAIHALSQTTFVAVVTSPVLALLTPLLERSLNAATTSQEVLRQTVVIVENLTKLVHDPVEARTFLPKLRPGVQKVQERASLPEVRELAASAICVINKAMGGDNAGITNGVVTRTVPEDVLSQLDKQLSKSAISSEQTSLWTNVKLYIAEMVAEDVNQRAIDRTRVCSEPYLTEILDVAKAEAVSSAIHQHYADEDARKFGAVAPKEDEEVEIVNADFSLGYGGMLLLSHTNLRLLKGHRYGLLGRNGAGKSTLMRSIAEDKLESFPPPDQVKTCFVEHNQGEDADLNILDYISSDSRFTNESQTRISTVLAEVGFDAGPEGRQSQKVGSLSGGWKMKLALARAMLMRADVLLLDEPTNHLDAQNVQWLEEYLNRHTEITSLIVSHDSGFLDTVCTDIYHYENKKLVLYKGNLAAFVAKKPEATSYYKLSGSEAQFKFPPPGILSGVKSMTRSILRMTDCTYAYPGSKKPSLSNASCQLSLSSRVAVIGPNGAGKSTLIKVLTGEVVPQHGAVQKHPNLRIGYIKQHALEHVEMHLEKTPTQYLLWRYSTGEDREVLMKQSRQMSEEEKEQMAKHIQLAPGVGGRIEAILGRQKYQKSFQYEVKWVGKLPKHNTMITRETLISLGFSKLVQQFDDHEASREGLGYRILEPSVISKHFEGIGLDPDIANHNEISGLSGGQKVKVVLAGAMWNNPHLLILDEPTNFLDRSALGGLAVAVRDFKGGVIMISHNEEFVGALCPEQWHVRDGRLEHKGHLAVHLDRFDSGSATPGSSQPPSTNASAANSETEGGDPSLLRARKKKKKTRAQQKEQDVRRRLRHLEWLNSPKGTPHPPDSEED